MGFAHNHGSILFDAQGFGVIMQKGTLAVAEATLRMLHPGVRDTHIGLKALFRLNSQMCMPKQSGKL